MAPTETRQEAILSLGQVREALTEQMTELRNEARMLRERTIEVEGRITGIAEAQDALERLAQKAAKDAP